METLNIQLWDKNHLPDSYTGFRPYIETYLLDTDKPLGAVLVCPGGGYIRRAPHEGETIAKRFNDFGYHAVVVQYRVAPEKHPAPIQDVSRALRIMRLNADKWKIKPNKIAVCGFSAGGHLTASLGVHFGRKDFFPSYDEADKLSNRPDTLILCYPVISSGAFAHVGSFNTLLGQNASQDMLDLMSLEKQVTSDTPPSFLWHTADDSGVPVENSLLFASALSRLKIPFETHVFPFGNHGLGLAPADTHVARWFELCCEWLKVMGW